MTKDEDHAAHIGHAPLRVQLEVHLDRVPVTGRLRTDWGADEHFVGWLGFVDSLRQLSEQRPPEDPADPRTPS